MRTRLASEHYAHMREKHECADLHDRCWMLWRALAAHCTNKHQDLESKPRTRACPQHRNRSERVRDWCEYSRTSTLPFAKVNVSIRSLDCCRDVLLARLDRNERDLDVAAAHESLAGVSDRRTYPSHRSRSHNFETTQDELAQEVSARGPHHG